jgi:hypothetical protein
MAMNEAPILLLIRVFAYLRNVFALLGLEPASRLWDSVLRLSISVCFCVTLLITMARLLPSQSNYDFSLPIAIASFVAGAMTDFIAPNRK